MPRPLPPPKRRFGWPLWRGVIAWSAIAAGMAFGATQVRAFLRRDSRFNLTLFEVQGAVYTNRARIQDVFAPDMSGSLFSIPLMERRRHLLAIDWVKTAAVSRIWPDKIVVSITERTPVAFAKLPIGRSPRYRLSLIDREGVLLSVPPRVRFRLPVLAGVTEEQTEADRRIRVEAMQHLLDDLGPAAGQVSEIDAAIPGNMRVITEIDNRAVELWMGDQHYRSRFLHFEANYPEIRKHSDRESVFDLRMDDRILAR